MSATIEVVDARELLLGLGRFTTDRAGFAAMRRYARAWPVRVWAVEGANGVGRPLAQRLLEAGEDVVDVPAKLAARARLLDTGHGRKSDAHDAHSVAVAAVRAKDLRVLAVDPQLQVLRMLVERREALTRRRVQTVARLQACWRNCYRDKREKDISTGQAERLLASVRAPRRRWQEAPADRRRGARRAGVRRGEDDEGHRRAQGPRRRPRLTPD